MQKWGQKQEIYNQSSIYPVLFPLLKKRSLIYDQDTLSNFSYDIDLFEELNWFSPGDKKKDRHQTVLSCQLTDLSNENIYFQAMVGDINKRSKASCKFRAWQLHSDKVLEILYLVLKQRVVFCPILFILQSGRGA